MRAQGFRRVPEIAREIFNGEGETGGMTTNPAGSRHRTILQTIARRAMLEKGLSPDFSPRALAQLSKIAGPAVLVGDPVRDLRTLLWCSIDNDDSRDLDQLTVAQALPEGAATVFVAIADVDALVSSRSAIDEHARQNTTSVYTAGGTFPMLPEKLSTDLTSLNPDADRLALVVEMSLAPDGSLQRSALYRATVRNRVRLTYHGVAAWLDGAPHEGIGAVAGLGENLRLQDRAAQQLKALRHLHGALDFESLETRPVFDGDELTGLEHETKNRAQELIEELMIAANGVVAGYLAGRNFPSLRRVVRVPKRWDRIAGLAAERGACFPPSPTRRR